MANEMKAITLKCSNCGSNLDITAEMNQFACGYCGSYQVVERKGGTIALKKVVDAVEKVQIGTDKTAAELALRRLSADLEAAELSARRVAAAADNAIASYSNSRTKGCLVTIAGTGLLGFTGVMFLVGGEKGTAIFLIVSAVLVAAVCGLITKSFTSSMLKERTKKAQALDPLHKEISDIKAKMAKQKEIVDA